ncbi:MAG: hypothetical protein SGILL_003467, partial [Bacillariaceae sp.]
MTTKCISSGIIGASGDLICQYLQYSAKEQATDVNNDNSTTTNISIDWHRTGRFFLMGSLWVAPVTNYWYTLLSTRLVPGKTTFKRVARRLVLDQFVFAPLFAPSFMGLLWLMEGKAMDDIVKDLAEVAGDIIVTGWVLWIPAMSINFSVIPLKFQVLFGNVVALAWNVYL